MKKLYVCLMAFAVGQSVTAQSTFDFESITLATESYDNGSAGNGDFVMTQSETISLSNYYDSNWSFWSGFAISNVTDNTTPGWSNQYGSYVGSGAGNSANFGVFYSSGSITGADAPTAITEFKITNTTYAALSMLNGDAFSKQFGSPLDAYGNPDGTNGEDYFRVWVLCESAIGERDSIEFYLADYRFADSTLDYIVDTWETIDLSGIAFPVNVIEFRFESSDNDPIYGMNTPAYFAIDDIKTETLVGVQELNQLSIQTFPNPATDLLNVVGESGNLQLVDAAGRIVFEQQYSEKIVIDVAGYDSGIYAIRIENASGSYTNRIVIK